VGAARPRDRLRAQSRPAADRQATRRSCGAACAQARASRGADRRGARRAGSSSRAPGDDRAPARHGPARAERPEHRPRPNVARRRAGTAAGMSILALDVGSSSIRAQRINERGEGVSDLLQEGYETDDPAEVVAAVRKVLSDEVPDATSCFAHSLVAVDEDWNALTPILGWRDTRSAAAAEWLARRLDAEAIHARTGAFLHPSFWPAKLAWLAETEPETFRRAAWFASFADYLRGSPETSPSMASTSGLLDLTTRDWDEQLLTTLGVGRERLPQIADVPVWPDAACSNAGAGCTTHDRAALMIGTSGALRVLYASD